MHRNYFCMLTMLIISRSDIFYVMRNADLLQKAAPDLGLWRPGADVIDR